MSWTALAALLGVHVAGMVTPGPDIFLILRTALRSRRHALAAVTGIVTGLTVWVTLTVAGLAAVLAAHPAVLGAVRLLGGAFLAWMGAGMIRGAVAGLKVLSDGGQPAIGAAALGPVGASFRQGLLTNLSNPKAVLYFMAVLSQFIPVGAPWWVQVVYVVALLVSSVLWFGFVALAVSTEPVVRRVVAIGPWIDLVAGVVFAGLGALFAWQGLAALM